MNLTKILMTCLKLIGLALIVLILFSTIKGYAGNPDINELNSKTWKENGPFELSPERGRFALTYSIVEEKRFHFTLPVARFATPDLGIKNDNYVSLFAPGVSYLIIPGYLIGKYFGASQVGAFSTIIVFAMCNIVLIYLLSKKLGASTQASLLSSFIFIFATPAFSYVTTIYQHHISVFLILFSLILLTYKKINFLILSTIWLLIFTSIPVDYPNLVLMLPIAILTAFKSFNIDFNTNRIKLSINFLYVFALIGAIIPLGLMAIFNFHSYGNYFQFASTVGGVQAIDASGRPTAPETANLEDVDKFINPEAKDRSAVNFFKSRHQLKGLYILLFSPDRGVLVFTPILILSLLYFAFHKKIKDDVNIYTILSILVFNIVIYSMRSDAYGGWAFGSRYLIPAYSILSIFLSVVITKFRRNILFIVLFATLMIYSIFVNTLGALTTSANPPKVEALPLEALTGKRERYSYDRNWEFLTSGRSKSFVFQTWAKNYVDSVTYYYIISGTIILLTTSLLILVILKKDENKN
jgi:hypothetical protein